MRRVVLPLLLAAGVCVPAGAGESKWGKDALDKVKAGKGTLTDEQVVKLLGAPSAVRKPGQFGADFHLVWEEAARIEVEFDEGKVVGVSGSFSDRVASKAVNLANFKRLRVGMTQADVRQVLGAPSQGRTDPRTRHQVHTWERARRVTVLFKDGKVSGFSSSDSTRE